MATITHEMTLDGYKIVPSELYLGTQGGYGNETLHFNFDAQWTGLKKFVIWSTGQKVLVEPDNTSAVPLGATAIGVDRASFVVAGILGSGDTAAIKLKSCMVSYTVDRSIDEEAVETKECVPGIFDEIIAKLNNIDAYLSETAEKVTAYYNTTVQVNSELQSSRDSASLSSQRAAQAYSDLLATIGTAVAPMSGGKIPMQYIPATATQEIFEVSSESELTALVAQRGDLAELVETVNNERTVTKTWQLLGTDATLRSNWVVWGTSYAVSAGNAATAQTAENSTYINGRRMVYMTQTQYENAVHDDETFYVVYDDSGVSD